MRPPIPTDTCNHKGPDGHRCEHWAGHEGLHACCVVTSSGDYEIREWTDAGQRVLDRPAVARAMKR